MTIIESQILGLAHQGNRIKINIRWEKLYTDLKLTTETQRAQRKNFISKETWNFTSIMDSATSNFTHLYIIQEEFCPEKT